jgi:hypothetical protein
MPTPALPTTTIVAPFWVVASLSTLLLDGCILVDVLDAPRALLLCATLPLVARKL